MSTGHPKKVLIAVTNHDHFPGKQQQPTGRHCSEVSHPLARFQAADLPVEFVSPEGGPAPMDPASADRDDPINARFLDSPNIQEALQSTRHPAEIDPADYGAIYFAGGHSTMWDFPQAKGLQDLAAPIYENGGVIGAVCHGPAALVNLRLNDGKRLVEGRNVACFSNEEERMVGKDDRVPFLLARRLEQMGAEHVFAEPFEPCVEVSERLVTGQNPASADGVADEVIRLLKAA